MTRDEPPRSAESVRVCVRCRPTNEQEASQRIAVSVDEGAQQVVLASGGSITDPPRCFTFDHVFGPKSRQEDVYVAVVADLVASVLAGVNATVFCYGQTGTGKTYTMEGTGASLSGPLLPDAGIIPRTFQQIFNAIGASQAQVTFLVCASMYEIYNEKVRDLLSKTPKNQLELHEGRDGGVYIKGLSTFLVKSQAEIGAVLEVGKRNRTVGTTLMNQDSSRSHSVFTVTVESVDAAGGGAAFRTGGDPGGSPGYGKASGIRVGKLNLVDLAGSERQSKTGAMGERLKEATKINLSLSALGNVISALVHGVDGKSGHVPYRDSKLTRLLQDSLGGNTRTVMIANVGPAASNYEETLGTLRYANRTKNIQNRPRINEDPKAKDTMMREFQDEIAKLKAQLATAGAEGSFEDDAATGSPCASKYRSPGSLIAEAAAANMQLDPEEVDRMRQQLEGELRAEHSSSGIVLSDKALAQMKEEVEVQLAEQVKQVHAEQQRAVKKATRLEQQLQQQAAQMQQVATWKNEERAHNAELSTKLHTLESKLLHGEQRGGLDELAKQTATQLSRQEEELKKERAAEAEAAQRIATLEASTYAVQSQYSSLQDEAEALGAQLEAAVAQYEVTKAEQGDVYTQWERDREDLVEEIRSLHYNLALKNLLIDAFIPQEEVSKLLQCATFNSSDGTWSLRSGSAAPPSLPKRPASAILRAGRPTSVQEGLLLELQLDIPERKMLSAPSTSITAVYSEIPLD